MNKIIPPEALKIALKAYRDCSQELENTLNEAKEKGLNPVQVQKISELNKHCDLLLEKYLVAYKAYYGAAE